MFGYDQAALPKSLSDRTTSSGIPSVELDSLKLLHSCFSYAKCTSPSTSVLRNEKRLCLAIIAMLISASSDSSDHI